MSAPATLEQDSLTPREREVLQHAAFGLTNRRIGEALGIAEQTVKNHLANAMRKLSLHDRTHAVVIAIGQGLIRLPVNRGRLVVEIDVSGHASAETARAMPAESEKRR